MKQVKIADLKNNLSRHLAYVREGGELYVCDRDVPIARVVPFGAARADAARGSDADEYWSDDCLARLERQGTIERSHAAERDWVARLKPRKLPRGVPDAVQVLIRERRESTR